MAEATPQRVILEGWFSLLVPPGWTWAEDGGVTSLFAESGGYGAINASLFHRPGTAPPNPGELREHSYKFAQNLGARLAPQALRDDELDDSPASAFEALDDSGDLWRVWHIASDQRLVLLTYNCAAGDAAQEKRQIDRIVGSFKWEARVSGAPGTGHAGNGR